MICSRFFMLVLLSAMATASNAEAFLRIGCEGDDIGAEVFVNGQFKGEWSRRRVAANVWIALTATSARL